MITDRGGREISLTQAGHRLVEGALQGMKAVHAIAPREALTDTVDVAKSFKLDVAGEYTVVARRQIFLPDDPISPVIIASDPLQITIDRKTRTRRRPSNH
jgi:hypothetical protein